jgi:hypothetical protein
MNRNLWLGAVVKKHLGDVDIAVEVGVWRGDYSRLIVGALAPTKFYGVDPYQIFEDYKDQPDPVEFANQQNLDRLHDRVVNNYRSLPGTSLMRSTGIQAAQQFDDNSIDFVYIDGDHTYEFVSKDIAAWWPKVRAGGILSGHDYTPGNPRKGHVYGVIEAVTEFAQQNNLEVKTTDEEYATWWVVKI